MSNIIEHKHIEEILPYIKTLTDQKNTLVLFDIDDVLINPKTQFGGFRWWSKKLNELTTSGIPLEKALAKLDDFYVKIQPPLTYSFIEPSTPSVFNAIQKTEATIMGLTGRPEGSSLLTHKQLEDLGIHFGSHDSIIFCNGGCKGNALNTILTRMNYQPKQIIFIDDVEKNLTDVQEMLQKTRPNTNFLGIHYTHINSFITFDAAQAEQEWQNIKQIVDNKISL